MKMLRTANDNHPAPTPQHLQLTAPESVVTLTDPDQSIVANGNSASNAPTSPTFSMVAYTGDAMRVMGWRYPVVVDLSGLQIPSQRRPIRFAHSAFQGIGHTERITVTTQGNHQQLVAEGVISRDTPAAREVVASGKKGFPWQASIGASVDQTELIPPGSRTKVNGREFEGPVYIAQRSTLGEISFVDLGADQQTSAQIAANLEAGEADVTTRANQGWRATAPTLRECTAEFEMLWKPGDAGFDAIKTAYLTSGTLRLAVLTGDQLAEGTEGPVGDFSITNFSRGEPLEEAVMVSVTAKLAVFNEWYEVPLP